jgi:hypothetical protein
MNISSLDIGVMRRKSTHMDWRKRKSARSAMHPELCKGFASFKLGVVSADDEGASWSS